MKILKVTPILVVDAIEPVLPLWTGPLGFTNVAAVPHGDALGFVMLTLGERAVMLQSRASIAEDLPSVLERKATSFLYLDVEDLDVAMGELKGAEVLVPERKTFYGTREFWVRDASGQVLGFAQDLKG